MAEEPKYLYMLVTDDELELPIYVEDTVRKLAEKTGKSENTISSAMSKAKKDGKKCRFHKIPTAEEAHEAC